jgi:hypothetical protein
MYRLLFAAMVLGAIAEFDVNPKDLVDCRSRQCIQRLAAASHKVLKIDWKPISVFPEEARKFGH